MISAYCIQLRTAAAGRRARRATSTGRTARADVARTTDYDTVLSLHPLRCANATQNSRRWPHTETCPLVRSRGFRGFVRPKRDPSALLWQRATQRVPGRERGARILAPCSLLPAPCSPLPAPCSLLLAPCSLLPAPCVLCAGLPTAHQTTPSNLSQFCDRCAKYRWGILRTYGNMSCQTQARQNGQKWTAIATPHHQFTSFFQARRAAGATKRRTFVHKKSCSHSVTVPCALVTLSRFKFSSKSVTPTPRLVRPTRIPQ